MFVIYIKNANIVTNYLHFHIQPINYVENEKHPGKC